MKAILHNSISKCLNPITTALIGISMIVVVYTINIFTKNTTPNRLLEEEKDPRTVKPNEICMQIEDTYLFDLTNLSKIQAPFKNQNLNFTFCESSCWYYEKFIEGDQFAFRISGPLYGEEDNYNKITLNNYKDEDKSKRNLIYHLAAGQNCLSDSKQRYKIDIYLQCDDKEEFSYEPFNFNPHEDCKLDIRGKSKYACGEDKYKAFIFHQIVDGIIFLLIGIFLGFFGYKAIEVNIVVVFLILFAFLSFMIINLANITSKTVIILIFVFAGLIAIGLSVLFIIKKKILLRYFMLIVCGLCGFIFGTLLFNMLFALINTKHQAVIRYAVIIGFVVVGVVLGVFLPKYISIIGTSVVGSYLMMRGLSCFLYQKVPFIEERKIYDLARSKNFKKIAHMIGSLFLIYPGILVVLIIITIIVQIKINPNWKEMDYKDLDKTIDKNISPKGEYILGEEDD